MRNRALSDGGKHECGPTVRQEDWSAALAGKSFDLHLYKVLQSIFGMSALRSLAANTRWGSISTKERE